MDFKGLLRVKPEMIDRDPCQPRRIFDTSALEALARSISEVGLLQPLLVLKDQGRFRLLAGERRLIASMMAGLEELPVVIVEPDPAMDSVIAMVENIHRKDLTALEQARAVSGIMEETGWTQAETGRRVGLSQPSIANKMRLLDLDEKVQDLVLEGRIGERHARALIGLSSETQCELAERASREGLSARIVEKLARPLKKKTKNSRFAAGTTPLEKAILADISEAVQHKREQGLSVKMKVRSVGKRERKLEILVTIDCEEAVT